MKKEKIALAQKYNIWISPNSFEIKSNEISIENFINMLMLRKNENINLLFNSISEVNDNIIKGIVNICSNKEYKKALIKLVNNMKIINEYDGEYIFPEFINERFPLYINIIEIKDYIEPYKFIKEYKRNTRINNFYSNKEMFNKYIKDNERIIYKIDNINDYYEIREKHFIELINNNDKLIIEKILNSYFNFSLKELQFIIERYKDIIKDKKKFEYLTNITKYNNEELTKYIRYAKTCSNYFVDLEKEIKEHAINDLVIKVNNQKIISNPETFKLLLHRIKGLLNGKMYDTLMNDMKEWNKHYDPNSTISCSLIDELYIALTPGYDLTIGFSNITKEDILAMNIKDSFYTKKDILSNMLDIKSNYMNTELFLENSEYYNEVLLRRYREGEAIMPDYILSLDKIRNYEKEVSKDLNIPILFLDLEKYAYKFINTLNYLKNNDYNKYLKYIKRFEKQVNYINGEMNHYYDIILESNVFKTDDNEVNEVFTRIKKRNSKK